jgi:hypothetical protein
MNPLNHATLEASKRLVDAGIVLETEAFWFISPKGTGRLINYKPTQSELEQYVDGMAIAPAPSMAEVWRKLPLGRAFVDAVIAYYSSKYGESWPDSERDLTYACVSIARHIDDLIRLLIWLRKEQGK